MPTNLYFNNFNSRPEQRLFEDLVGEVVKIYGIDSYFLPRGSDSTFDLLFGDDPTKKFEEAYPVEVYIDNVDRFDGEELFSKFGLEIRETINFIMPFRAFSKTVPLEQYERPREGDLLWLSNFQVLFEIKYVKKEHFFFQFGKQDFYGFKLICEKFRYNSEKLDTGVIAVDDLEGQYSVGYNYIMKPGGTLTYQADEIVYQGASYAAANATAVVASWDKPSLTMKLVANKGTFAVNTAIVGTISGASYELASVDTLDSVNDPLDNNRQIQDEADDILDFSENNPFGEP